MTGQDKTLCLVDASAYVFRAYHAIRGLTNDRGMATNALFGYVNMLLKAVRELSPSHVAVVMDPIGKSFRHDLYPEYKANRPPPPDDLKEQFPYVEPLTQALGYPTVRVEGFEADDIIATLARQGHAAGMRVVVVTGDKDLMQLVNGGIRIFDPMRDKWYDAAAVQEKFGVAPEHIVDYLAIVGDSSDNVPGIKGIGAKGAAKLIGTYGALEEVLAHAGEVSGKRQSEALANAGDQALLSKRLVVLRDDVPLPLTLDGLAPHGQQTAALRDLFQELGFRKLAAELLPGSGGNPETAPAEVETPVMPEPAICFSTEDLSRIVDEVRRTGHVSLDTETTSTRPMEAKLVGISLCTDPGRVHYIPLIHRGARADKQLPLETVREIFGPVVADPAVKITGQNFKYDAVVLRNHGFDVAGLDFDTMLASYLLDPGRRSHGLDALAAEHLGIKLISYKEVTGGGRGGRQVTFDYVPIKEAARYAGEDAWATLLLAHKLGRQVDEVGLTSQLREVEVPVSDLLARMEQRGVCVDMARLGELSADYAERMGELEVEIYALAGCHFNLASPKQLSEVLFERLKLPRSRKTKTGYSTDVRVLEDLAQKHALPSKMLEHRSLSKLKSTYADVLPTLVNRKTGRIHSSFNQAVTATGRLSSSDPNLQNIPIRGEEGRKIRATFVPGEKLTFLAADYSQIELRMMAHLAQDKVLREAFTRGEDIHARTASEIFGVMPGLVSPDMRRVAKSINFGIIYGMSAFRLARDQQIPLKQAQGFIDRYFARYSGVKRFLDEAVRAARDRGYAETVLKRRRYLPDLNARNQQVRSMAERMAINTPVQGGAADIVKLAMLALDRRLREEKLPAHIILQVHDELVLEAAPEAAERVGEVVRETMEGAYELSVPLKVDLGIGANWAVVHG